MLIFLDKDSNTFTSRLTEQFTNDRSVKFSLVVNITITLRNGIIGIKNSKTCHRKHTMQYYSS